MHQASSRKHGRAPGSRHAQSVFLRLALLSGFMLSAIPAEALRIVPGSFKVEPTGEVYVTRTITFSCELEEEMGVGASGFDCDLNPDPINAANLLYRKAPDLTCTGSGRTRGVWVYQAVTPGLFRFVFSAGIFGCRRGLSYSVAQSSSPIEIKPLPVWSGQELTPQVVAPGQDFTLRIDFRNDAPFEIIYPLPVVSPEVFGEFVEIGAQVGKLQVVPASAVNFRERLLILPPLKKVSMTWRYRASGTGRARFLITGGGMVVNSPVVDCRIRGNLALSVPEPDLPGAVGSEFRLRARLGNTGEAKLKAPKVDLTWSPQGAAKLISSSFNGPDILTENEGSRDCLWRLELLEPGTMSLNVRAGATEVDTGRPVFASATRVLRILPPPELAMKVKLESSTLMVGSRADFSVIVENRSNGAALNVVPILSLKKGSGRFTPLLPIFQGILPGAVAVFRGGFIPDGAGPVEMAAQVSASGARDGPRVTASSSPVDLLAVPAPQFRVWTMNDRVYSGGAVKARLWIENAISLPVRIKTVQLSLAGVPAGSDSGTRVKFAPITLAPGSGATLYAEFMLGTSAKTDIITGSAGITGEILPYRLPFAVSVTSRLLALASPRASRIAFVEPANAFNPLRDMEFHAEVVAGKREELGMVVMTPEGVVSRTILRLAERGPGWVRVAWDGLDDAGKPVPAGRYVVRLAGPAPSGTEWPIGAKWKDDRQLQLERP